MTLPLYVYTVPILAEHIFIKKRLFLQLLAYKKMAEHFIVGLRHGACSAHWTARPWLCVTEVLN
jgi:hypothetical protein